MGWLFHDFDLQEVEGHGTQDQQKPEAECARRLTKHIPDADNADVEKVVPSMRFVDLLTGWCRETLDAIIAGAQKDRADYVDEHVKASVDCPRLVARALVKDPATHGNAVAVHVRKRDSPNSDGQVDDENDETR